ncbi:ABC transporter permease subunit [Haloechinothrix sp. LS1_15]|uniref:ABC transporter permease n=1 Tax=Haloechinothrix sp. LS1_15 TaxID=2652248 RepID=UPI0029479DDE|nr:ABC transporter permease subunit [Haloechinothrix sp. LS1_15]MDV6013673.1 ABC transporter permease subunit [Haloechinothrix sp. LS1_15]
MRIGEFDLLEPRLRLGDAVEAAFDWFTDTFRTALDGVSAALTGAYNLLTDILLLAPFYVVIVILAVLALVVRSWRFALFTMASFYLIVAMDQWYTAMHTLSLVLVAAAVAVALSIPLGILAAKSNTFEGIIRPVLDFMQTMPPLVYLIPALAAFGVGVTGGIVATVIFAMPPGVRFTNLAIRQVDTEVVEAGQAFGASPRRILRQIQLPLALPTIMAGINQVIMLSLSMVVLAAFVGAAGLGGEVINALMRLDVPQGAEAGLAVVILAIYLDRMVAALADRAPVVRASRVRT